MRWANGALRSCSLPVCATGRPRAGVLPSWCSACLACTGPGFPPQLHRKWGDDAPVRSCRRPPGLPGARTLCPPSRPQHGAAARPHLLRPGRTTRWPTCPLPGCVLNALPSPPSPGLSRGSCPVELGGASSREASPNTCPPSTARRLRLSQDLAALRRSLWELWAGGWRHHAWPHLESGNA